MEITVKQFLADNISRRYVKFTDEEYQDICSANSDGLIIADSLAPASIILDKKVPINSVFISQTLAALNGGTALPFDELLKILGIKLPEVKKKLNALKKEKLNLILVGYGGYSINTLEFLYQLCIRTGVTNLFKTLTIFEADNLTITNCFRIYKNVLIPAEAASDMQSKLALITDNYDGILSDAIHLVSEYLTPEIYTENFKGKRVVYLGAPDFDTRKLLEDDNFIFGGHAGDEVALISKPSINADITIESYGTINPAILFMNLLRATVALPDALMSEFPTNSVLFEYNFRDELTSGRAKNPYTWIIDTPTTAPVIPADTVASEDADTTDDVASF